MTSKSYKLAVLVVTQVVSISAFAWNQPEVRSAQGAQERAKILAESESPKAAHETAAIKAFAKSSTGPSGGVSGNNCKPDFLDAYTRTAEQAATVTSYSHIGKMGPNLPEATLVCRDLISRFPDTRCFVPSAGQMAATADFTRICKDIESNLVSSGQSIEKVSKVDNSTPMILIEPSRVHISVVAPDSLMPLAAALRSNFIIEGLTYSLKEAISMDSPVRCYMTQTGEVKENANWTPASFLELYQLGYREAVLSFNETKVGIGCLNNTGKSLTLGQFKEAFDGALDVQIK